MTPTHCFDLGSSANDMILLNCYLDPILRGGYNL